MYGTFSSNDVSFHTAGCTSLERLMSSISPESCFDSLAGLIAGSKTGSAATLSADLQTESVAESYTSLLSVDLAATSTGGLTESSAISGLELDSSGSLTKSFVSVFFLWGQSPLAV